MNKIKKILKSHPKGMTISDLSSQLKINRNLVAKYLDMLLISGQVEYRNIGPAKLYSLSHRVPLSAILEFSSAMIMILDSRKIILQVNEPFISTFALPRETLIGKRIEEVDDPFICSLPISELPGKLKENIREGEELQSILEGRLHHFRMKQVQTLFEDGSHGITVILEDVTSQERYKELLAISIDIYRRTIEDH